jgi:LmbE family N-acetylglucosaminyl deacetylase
MQELPCRTTEDRRNAGCVSSTQGTLPRVARVLAIGAHPDDLEFFAGATLARLAAAGAAVTMIICTDGARGGHDEAGLAARRREEATVAATTLGIGTPTFLGFRDGDLANDEALREALVRAIRGGRPELLLVHDPATLWKRVGDLVRFGHSDHRAAGQATLDAIAPRAPLGAYYPEHGAAGMKPWFVRETWLFDTARPEHFVDARPAVEAKHASLRCHVSQNPEMLLTESERLLAQHAVSAGFAAEGFQRLRMF